MLKDLSAVTGFTFTFDEATCHPYFGSEVRAPLYGVRTGAQLHKVLLDQEADLPPFIYWMMRDLGLKDEPYRKETHDLRFDITLFVAAMLGREHVKTAGHYHTTPPGGQCSYPEVYGVLSGRAVYLLQKVKDIAATAADLQVEDCIVVEGIPGDKIIMPPDYGHVTINRLPRLLVMANWVSDRFSSQYGAVEQTRGFAYYLIDGRGGPKWVKNPLYKDVPPLRIARAKEVPALGLTRNIPLLTAGQEKPELLDWLNNPQNYMEEIWSGLEIIGEAETYELE